MSKSEFKNYRDISRTNWGTHFGPDEKPDYDQIRLGAELRMADAMEAMAKNHVKLQDDYDYMKKSRDWYREKYDQLVRSDRSLKGVITKLKRRK